MSLSRNIKFYVTAIDDYDLIKIDLFGYVNYFLIKDGKPINIPYKYSTY